MAVVADAVLLAQTGNNYIWDREEGGPSIIYNTNTSDENMVDLGSLGPTPVLVYPETIISEGEREAYKALSQIYEVDTIQAFHQLINTTRYQ